MNLDQMYARVGRLAEALRKLYESPWGDYLKAVNSTFENVMMAVVLAYFGGRSGEKAASIFKK